MTMIKAAFNEGYKPQALVISAFPGCGKTYFFNKHKEYMKVLDSDSSMFSWIYNDDGTKERHPDFPNNYIRHIKENLDTQDIIFVSSHAQVRKALYDAGIKFVLVFPSTNLKEEWMLRLSDRGSSEEFVKLIGDNWNSWLKECNDDTLASGKYLLTKIEPWISDLVIENISRQEIIEYR